MLETIASDVSSALDRLDEQAQRRRAEAALRESNERLKKVIEVETVGVMFWEMPSGVMIDANESFLKLMGYSRQELEARELSWQKLTLPEFLAASREELRRFEQTGRVGPYEKQYLRKDGTRQWLLFAGSRLDSGTIVEFCVDISARKQAEQEVRQQASLIESLLDSIPDLIFFKDLHGVYAGCNPAFAGFVGRASEEIVGKTDYELFPKEAADFFRKQDAEMLKSLQPRRNEEWVNYPDGRRVLLDTLKLPYRAPDGTLLGVLGVSRDITEREAAEEKLRESEQRFRALVETAPEAIFVRTGERFAYVNGAAMKLFGARSADQLLGAPVVDRFKPEYRQEVRGRMDELDLAGRSTLEAERVLLRIDGAEVEASISAVPITFEGKPSALVFARDISDRKRVEAALWQQVELQKQLANIAATVPGTIYSFRLRPDGSMAMPYASAAVEEIFGVPPEQIRENASPILSLIHPQDARRVTESILISARSLTPWREEFRGRGTRRGEIWVEGHSMPQLEPDGSVLWHGFLQDITERKSAEEQLRKLSRAVEQSPASIVITDAEGLIEYVNPKFTELTGYTLEEARGKNPRILKTGRTSVEEYQRLWQTITRGETWRGEFHNRKKNGQEFWEFASISPVIDDEGMITHFLAVKEDITERKKLEEHFRQSQKLEAIGQLAGGVAHDFNNILAAMMMQAEFSAAVEGTPAKVVEGLQEIRAATERAAALTRQLLLFGRKQVLQPRELDLNEVVTSLAKMLQRIIREDVRLQLHLHTAPLHVRADAGMLDQVLMNLAVNARDAMPKGGRLLVETSETMVGEEAARMHPDAAPGRYVCLSVTDTGSGMTPEVMSRIFEPFFTTKEPGKGTGLGLATVFGIVKQHKGWVTVQSEPSRGACFQVYLPASEGRPPVEKVAARPGLRTGTETILLVEDDSALRNTTRRILERQGFQVLEAANGVEALRFWKQHRDRVALLLTDLVMPEGMNGQQLAGALQISKPDLRVVFTSGYSAEIAGGEIRLRSGENFIQKPCSPAELLEVIRKTLDS